MGRFEVPTFVVVYGVCPVEVFEDFGTVLYWNIVFDSVVHFVIPIVFEKQRVVGLNLVDHIDTIGNGDIFVPMSFSGRFFPFERVKLGGRQRNGRELQTYEFGVYVVALTKIGGKRPIVAKSCGIGNGGGGGVGHVVTYRGCVLIVFTAYNVDVDGKSSVRMGFNILGMSPLYFKISL